MYFVDNYTTNNTLISTRKAGIQCPFEYSDTGLYCIRALAYPSRPLHIAETECKVRFRSNLAHEHSAVFVIYLLHLGKALYTSKHRHPIQLSANNFTTRANRSAHPRDKKAK